MPSKSSATAHIEPGTPVRRQSPGLGALGKLLGIGSAVAQDVGDTDTSHHMDRP